MTGNSLPKGWRLVKFGDLVRKVSSRVDPESSGISRYVAGEHMDSDNLNITRWGIVGDGYLGPAFTMRFQPGQVLYGSRRTYLRKVALADFEGICANTTFVLETKSADLLQEFLPHVMSTERFHAHSISKSKGSVNPYINFVDLNDYEFALPPIAEQRRIISLMLSTNHLQLQSIEALTVAEKQLANVCIRLTTTTKGGSKNIEEVAEILDSQRVPVNDAERLKRSGEIPYYGSNGQVGWIDKPLFSEPLTLVAEDAGYFSDWRKSPIAYRIDGPSWVNNHAHVLRATCVPAGWLYFSLRNRDLTKIIVGTTRTKLNRKALSGLNIEMPEDLHQRLEILEKFEDVVQKLLGKVMDEKILGKSLLNRLLSGNLSDV